MMPFSPNIAALTLSFLALTSCATTPFPPHSPRAATDAAQPPNTNATPTVGEGTQIVMRAILQLPGTELPCTVRIWRRWPDALRIIASEDLGGTLLHVVQVADLCEIIQASPALQSPDMQASLVRNLAHWLLFDPTAPAQLRRIQTENARLFTHSDRQVLAWRESKTPQRQILAVGTPDTLHARISWTCDADQRPAEVLLEDLRLGYTLSLETAEWQPASLPPKTFQTKR